MTWTHFYDMHSGGGTKEEPYEHIYIEAPEDEAELIFYNRFGHDPNRVTCSCCGSDYSISESATLEEASAYHRGCDSGYVYTDTSEELPDGVEWRDLLSPRGGLEYNGRAVEERVFERQGKKRYAWTKNYLTVEEFAKQSDILIIRSEEIADHERKGQIRQSGWVWVD